MYLPTRHPVEAGETLADRLQSHGVSRREFLDFCGRLAVVLGLGEFAGPRLARALEAVRRPSVIWIQLQECTGCVESVLRTVEPTIGNLVLDTVSLDYSHTLMAAAGHQAEAALQKAMKENAGKYLLIVTGSVPLADGGVYTTIGGRTAKAVLEEAAQGAAAIVAVGACAHWGSVQAARPNPTGAVGVSEVIKDKPVINVAGCPPIGDVVTATVAHFLTFNRLPAVDSDGRPLFAYGKRIHDQCPRRAHFDAGQYVDVFGVGADASAIAAFGANAFTMARIGLISVTLMGAATLAFGAALMIDARLRSWRAFVGATGLLVGAWPLIAGVSGKFYPGPFTSVHWTSTAISLGLWYLLLGTALPRLRAPVKAEELATG